MKILIGSSSVTRVKPVRVARASRRSATATTSLIICLRNIMMSKDCHTVRMYSYDKRSCRLYEQRFDKEYTFMKVSCEGDREVFSISWDDVVVLLGSPVIKALKVR